MHWLAERFQRRPGEPLRERMRVVYDRPREALPHGQEMYRRVRESGVLERVAAEVNAKFALPRPITLRVIGCGVPDAWYDARSAEVSLCYERLAHFVELSAELQALRASRLSAEPAESAPAAPAGR